MIRLTTLFLTGLLSHAQAQEITIDHITAAVCQVESGCIYNRPGSIRGKWEAGAFGEAGYWQISPMVLRDLKATKAQAGDALMGERLFRRWYLYLYMETGNHPEALAAYHRGLGGRFRPAAKAYAERCMNLATALSKPSAPETK